MYVCVCMNIICWGYMAIYLVGVRDLRGTCIFTLHSGLCLMSLIIKRQYSTVHVERNHIVFNHPYCTETLITCIYRDAFIEVQYKLYRETILGYPLNGITTCITISCFALAHTNYY